LALRVEPAPGNGYRCSRCRQGVLFAYDHLPPRRIRDFPWAGHPCEWEVTLARVECPACRAVAVEWADWIEPYARQTDRHER
jgi:transposase